MVIQELTKGIHDCPCGRDHNCPVDYVDVSDEAVDRLPEYTAKYRKILVVADENTARVLGDRVVKILGDKVSGYAVLSDNGDHVVIPNEEKIEEIKSYYSGQDLILGVGSGVINDLCKYVSFDEDVPYYIVGTAPSMDGYVSVGCAMILGGMKVTTNARPPKAVIADPEVLRNAPLRMIQAGYGDIIGKFSCLNDWKLSAFLNREYFCDVVYKLMYDTALQVKMLAEGVRTRDKDAVAELMKALIVAGIAMSYVNNSRPASGAEHHLSHFFEITGILHNEPYFCHGIDVVYSTVQTARIRERIRKIEPKAPVFDREKWETNVRRIYTGSADGVIALQDKVGLHGKDEYAKVVSLLPKIREILSDSPSEEEVREMIAAVGLDYKEFEEVYSDRKRYDALWYARELKDRYTVLWLLDYFPEAAPFDASKIKVVAMDLDGTLCQHKTHLPEENKAVLRALSEKYKLLMVGAGMCQRIFNQMEKFPVDVLGTYGLQYCQYNKESGEIDPVFDKVLPVDRESISERVKGFRERHGFTDFAGDSVEFHASGVVTIPILGTKAVQEDKLSFDPDRRKRRALYPEVVSLFPEYNVFVGGSSSYDMAPRPFDKAYALRQYAEMNGLSENEIVYIGDDYGQGGNDESVFLSKFPYLTIDHFEDFPEVAKALL